MEKIKVASLFCGCGGMDLGVLGGFSYLGRDYKRNRFDIVYSVDNDEYCTQIYNANFNHKCIVKDVRDINAQDIPSFDLLIGGFPCQSFSISAQNPPRLGYKDVRGMLFFEMVKILKHHRPRFFIAENVKGIMSANKGLAFPMILREFESAGYTVMHRLLNAWEYGVPQRRERVIIVGFRDIEDAKRFSYPAKVKQDEQRVLRDVIEEDSNNDESLFFSQRAVAGMMAVRSKMNKGREMHLDRPCNTISAHLAKVSLNSTDPVYKVGNRFRRFSVREAARIQSFPDAFKLGVVSNIRQYKAIGNAVPPVMMWHVAKALQDCIGRGQAVDDISEEKMATIQDTPSERFVQLSLFDPTTLYRCTTKANLLIGSCRRGTKEWIKTHQLYNYPITETELLQHPELLKAKQLLVMRESEVIGFFSVRKVDVVAREWLGEHDYPVHNSRHAPRSKYLLFTLAQTRAKVPEINAETVNVIIGKGVIEAEARKRLKKTLDG